MLMTAFIYVVLAHLKLLYLLNSFGLHVTTIKISILFLNRTSLP